MDDPELCPFRLQTSADLVAINVCPKDFLESGGLEGAPDPPVHEVDSFLHLLPSQKSLPIHAKHSSLD